MWRWNGEQVHIVIWQHGTQPEGSPSVVQHVVPPIGVTHELLV